MSGIYIHIPFCKQACSYCDFHFSTSLKRRDEMISAIQKDLSLKQKMLEGEEVETIYFGGGTPSILRALEIELLLQHIRAHFDISEDVEVCLEANPDDLSAEKLKEIRELGVNRLSIGVQSFDDELLRLMNRSHNANEAKTVLTEALKLGFNLSVDLIYGIPNQSDQGLKEDVERLVSLGIPHVSVYALTIEERTALHHQVQKGELIIDEDQQSRQHYILLDHLNEAGYEAYELSNYALPGYRSRHNSSYWESKKYLGVGPSAHSYDGKKRFWNVRNNAAYIKALKEGGEYSEQEELNLKDKFNEMIMTKLRLIEGIDLKLIEEFDFSDLTPPVNITEHLKNTTQKHLACDWLIKDKNCLRLSREGRFFADRIASDLFLV